MNLHVASFSFMPTRSNCLDTVQPLKDLPELCQLLRVCAERLARDSEYEEPLCKIVGLCG